MSVLDALTELFTWIGFGVGALLAGLALLLFLLDGTWVPVRAVVEHTDRGPVVRWFDEQGEVNEAPLDHGQQHALVGRDMADVYARRGWRHRMRLTPGSPLVRGVGLFAAGFVALGVVSLAVSWVVLFLG